VIATAFVVLYIFIVHAIQPLFFYNVSPTSVACITDHSMPQQGLALN
jgi:hypothetical protein